MNKPMTVRQVLDGLEEITDHKEFKAFLDKNVMALYESEDFKIYWKLKCDIAGLLFAAIHGSTDVGE